MIEWDIQNDIKICRDLPQLLTVSKSISAIFGHSTFLVPFNFILPFYLNGILLQTKDTAHERFLAINFSPTTSTF